MRHVERSGDLPVDPDAAFAFIADLDNLPRWQSGVTGPSSSRMDRSPSARWPASRAA